MSVTLNYDVIELIISQCHPACFVSLRSVNRMFNEIADRIIPKQVKVRFDEAVDMCMYNTLKRSELRSLRGLLKTDAQIKRISMFCFHKDLLTPEITKETQYEESTFEFYDSMFDKYFASQLKNAGITHYEYDGVCQCDEGSLYLGPFKCVIFFDYGDISPQRHHCPRHS
jgi:hypothetical protein